jgi:Etoposide-induced protein 2.4 (EI24)
MTTHTPQTPVQHSHSWLATKAMLKASLGLLNPKIWALSFMPLLLGAALWGGIAYFAWEPLNDALRAMISGVDMPNWLPDWLPSRGVWIPLTILLVTIPGVMVTAIVLVAVFGTHVVARRVALQYGIAPLAQTTLARSAGLLASLWHSAWVLGVLCTLWLLTLPVWLIPGLGLIVPLMLLGWANARLFSRDVLIDFATDQERAAVLKNHRTTLWGLGLVASVPSFIPAFLWLGGAIVVVALPAMALLATWLYVMIFLATSLLFSHYLIAALSEHRASLAAAAQAAQSADALAQTALDAGSIETSVKVLSPTNTAPAQLN